MRKLGRQNGASFRDFGSLLGVTEQEIHNTITIKKFESETNVSPQDTHGNIKSGFFYSYVST